MHCINNCGQLPLVIEQVKGAPFGKCMFGGAFGEILTDILPNLFEEK